MATLWKDLRYAARLFGKRPGFTTVVMLTLALGIGANTAIFSIVNAVILRPLPLPDADRLLSLTESKQGVNEQAVAHRSFVEWRRRATVFDGLAAYVWYNANLESGSEPERVIETQVSQDFFAVTGMRPKLGRVFRPEEFTQGNHRVMLLSYELWLRRFGGDPLIVNQPIRIHNEIYMVVGVMPPTYRNHAVGFGDLWTPLSRSEHSLASLSATRWLQALARLRPGVGAEQARAELEAIQHQLAREFPETHADYSVALRPLRDVVVGDARPALFVLLGAVGVVLLIACANVAGLLLARGASREKEMAVRAALGASHLTLMRQLLTESLLLASLGAGVGLALAAWGLKLLPGLGSAILPLPRLDEVRLDASALGVTLAATLLTAVLCGLLPALGATKVKLTAAIKEGGRGGAGAASRRRVGRALVVTEIAFAFVLLAGAGLLLNSFARLLAVSPGFRAEGVLTMGVYLPETRYEQAQARITGHRRILERMAELAGVESAAFISELPLRKRFDHSPLVIEGQPPAPPGQEPVVYCSAVTNDYFRVMRVPLVAGRVFTEREVWEKSGLAVVNETMARRYWGEARQAIGRRVRAGAWEGESDWATVVGVVGDVKQSGIIEETQPEVYQPYADTLNLPMTLVLRAKSDPASLTELARREVRKADSLLPVYNVAPMSRILADALAYRRTALLLLALFAGVALALAGLGVYGVVSYTVAERTREIGIRMALGARASDALRMILGEALRLAFAGVGLGLLAALALTRAMKSLLYGVGTIEPLTFASVSALLALVALVACYLPARRAAKTDPLVALRMD